MTREASNQPVPHTPGPWVVEGPNFGHFTIRQDPEQWNGQGYQAICGMPSLTRRSALRPTFEANARLIAAAPSLLAALKVADAAINPLGGMSLHDWNMCLKAATATIRAAIAKVEGR